MKLISVIYSRDVLRQIKDESARQEEQRSALLSRIYTLTLILVITVFTYRNTWIWMWIRDITLRLQIAFIPECCIVFPVLFNYLNSCCQMFCNKSVAYTLSNRYHWWVPTYVYCNSLKCIETQSCSNTCFQAVVSYYVLGSICCDRVKCLCGIF